MSNNRTTDGATERKKYIFTSGTIRYELDVSDNMKAREILQTLDAVRSQFGPQGHFAKKQISKLADTRMVKIFTSEQRKERSKYLEERQKNKEFNKSRVEVLKDLRAVEAGLENEILAAVKSTSKFGRKTGHLIKREELNELRKPLLRQMATAVHARIDRNAIRRQDFSSLSKRNKAFQTLDEKGDDFKKRLDLISNLHQLERNARKANPSKIMRLAYTYTGRNDVLDRKIHAAKENCQLNVDNIKRIDKGFDFEVKGGLEGKSRDEYLAVLQGRAKTYIGFALNQNQSSSAPKVAAPTTAPAAAPKAAAPAAAPKAAAPTAATSAATSVAPKAAPPAYSNVIKGKPLPPKPEASSTVKPKAPAATTKVPIMGKPLAQPQPQQPVAASVAVATAETPKLYVINGHGGKIAGKTVQANGRIITPGNASDNYTLAFQDQNRHLEEVAREGKLWPLGGNSEWQVNQGAIADINIGPLEGDGFLIGSFLNGLKHGTSHRWSKLTNPPHDVIANGALALRQANNEIVVKQGSDLEIYLAQTPDERRSQGTPIFFCDRALGKVKPMGDTSLSEIMRGMEKVTGAPVPIVVATCGVTSEPGHKEVVVQTSQFPQEIVLPVQAQIATGPTASAPPPPPRTDEQPAIPPKPPYRPPERTKSTRDLIATLMKNKDPNVGSNDQFVNVSNLQSFLAKYQTYLDLLKEVETMFDPILNSLAGTTLSKEEIQPFKSEAFSLHVQARGILEAALRKRPLDTANDDNRIEKVELDALQSHFEKLVSAVERGQEIFSRADVLAQKQREQSSVSAPAKEKPRLG